jgi:hypothetical protein
MQKNAAPAAPAAPRNNEKLGPGICPNLQIHQDLTKTQKIDESGNI